MKVIWYILLSYFQQRVLYSIAITAASLMFVLANAIVIRNVKAGWFLFLIALMIVTSVLADHLRNLIAGSASDLLPNYRRHQLKAAGLILAVFLGWPALFTSCLGRPVLFTLAIYLFAICLLLWPIFFMSANSCFSPLGFLAAFWLLIDVSRFIASSHNFSLIAYLGAKTGYFLPIFLIAISVIGLLLFVMLYQKISSAHFLYERDASGFSSRSHDKAGAFTLKIAGRAILRLARIKGSQSTSYIRTTHLFQFFMFQPGLAANTLFPYIIMLIFMAIVLSIPGFSLIKDSSRFYLLLICYSATMICTTDFLQHRYNMAAIYLHSHLPSRKSFIRTMVLTYLIVIFKQLPAFALLLIILQAIFHFISWTILLQVIVIASIINIIHISISLLVSDKVRSPYCTGYTVTNMILLPFILPLVVRGLHSFNWLFVAGIALAGSLLFWLALWKFAETEMDFIGPEIPG